MPSRGRFRVKTLKEKIIPAEKLEKLERVIVFGDINITVHCIQELLKRGIPVTFLSKVGEYFGSLEATNNVDIKRQRLQFEKSGNKDFCLAMSKIFIKGKMKMKDQFGREINYLRLSVTDNCNLRCIYCMPENLKNESDNNNLTINEYYRTVGILAKLGIQKVRITGGEPLTRKGIDELIGKINTIPEIKEIAITTNGILLDTYLDNFIKDGVTSLNISIDSVNKENFNKITRGGDLCRVTESLRKARDNGIKIKLNTVIIKGSNDHEISDLVKFAIENNVDIRFIELMPIGCARNLKGMKSQEIIEFLKKNSNIKVEENRIESHKINEELRAGPAQYYNISGTATRIGFISPLSSCFCDECNRIRVTSDGKMKQCLYYRGNIDLKELFRTENITDEELIKILEREIYTKNRKHEFNDYKKHNEKREERIMSSIGG